jgi:hypothetical protein
MRSRIERNEQVFPETIEELHWLCEAYPEYAGQVLPPDDELSYVGLEPAWRSKSEPLDETWQNRFLITLTTDSEFRKAVRVALSMTEGN